MGIKGDVLLVDEEDEELGVKDKLKAHEDGDLHRAVSVVIINSEGEILLQQRSEDKPIAPGSWSNTCCGHVHKGKGILERAQEKLKQEMGITCDLRVVYKFHYCVQDGHLMENEIDYVIVGYSDGDPILDPTEAMAYKWISVEDLREDIALNPEKYTYWFKIVVAKLFAES